MREQRLGRLEALRLLVEDPAQAMEVVGIMLAGAWRGALDSNAIASLIDGRRVQHAVPGAARSVDWADPGPFLDALTPLLTDTADALELGCGDGRISRLVAPHVAHLVCTDMSRTMVKEARENLAGYDNVRCERVGEASLSLFADDSVDVVFGQGVLTYMDPAALLALLDEVHRVLRPSGTCVFNFVTIDDEASVRYLVQAVRAGARKGRFSPAVERPYATAQIEAMYRAVGLDVIPPPSGDARGRTNVVGRKTSRPDRPGPVGPST